MCLAAFSIGVSDRFPLVLAANRDEHFARPTAALDWWTPVPEGPRVLSGRDLEAGGTWLGLSERGRLALLTNVREPGLTSSSAPSRGGIVTDWLVSQESIAEFRARHGARAYNGYNLIAADVSTGDWAWTSNRVDQIGTLYPGIYGVSNAALDTPWPKLRALKARLGAAVAAADALSRNGMSCSADLLALSLLRALADKHLAPDELLPTTGVSRESERTLSAAFIDARDRGYGTRSSSVVISEITHEGALTHVYEMTHATGPDDERPDRHLLSPPSSIDDDARLLNCLPALVRVSLKNWAQAA
jgi:uncharacterized protein with NRDE domain